MFRQRSAGILMHISSLPCRYGIGDLGPQALAFVDFLKQADQRFWQLLPLNATGYDAGYSPYNCLSAFAGNPLLISPDQLWAEGWLDRADLPKRLSFPVDRLDLSRVASLKGRLLKQAFARFCGAAPPEDFQAFCSEQQDWLQDYALFAALKQKIGSVSWDQWPAAIRERRVAMRKELHRELKQEILRQQFMQYCFWQQYARLRDYCHDQGVHLMGDIPIYVAHDSSDVWSHPELFKLDRDKRPKFKAGVPPDYFSKTGQLWGNPVYDWDHAAKDHYAWFIRRIEHNLALFDMVRIDHFRGLAAYWEVPGRHKTAQKGQWVPGPGQALFRALFDKLPFAQIFAEDLGDISAEVRELMNQFNLAGMKVLQFGFDGNPADNCHAPHQHAENFIVYTGTHDNNTTRGWFEADLNPQQKQRLMDTVGHKISARHVAWDLIRLAHNSVAKVAIVPLQDILNLGREARMNFPAKAKGNWRWRMRPGAASTKIAERLARLTYISGRS